MNDFGSTLTLHVRLSRRMWLRSRVVSLLVRLAAFVLKVRYTESEPDFEGHVPGNHVSKELCEAWGIDPSKVRRIETEFPMEGPSLVRITAFAHGVEVLKEYDLVSRKTDSVSL